VGQYGVFDTAVQDLIRHAGQLTIDEAADLYRARATHVLVHGEAADHRARINAERTAVRTGRVIEYEQARHAAASAWRGALPEVQGPWLIVGSAIANAAGALVLADELNRADFTALIGPWRQAIGTLVPVGPGPATRQAPPEVLVRSDR
jgi:hypothetical protein